MNYIEKLNSDLVYGLNKEKQFKPILEKYFNCNLEFTPNYHKFDYIDNEKKIMFEIKSRKNNYNKYPSTMIGLNKYTYSKNTDYECYFIFNFLDGLYYYKVNDNTLNECSVCKGGRKDRGRFEYNQYLYIPIELLNKITAFE